METVLRKEQRTQFLKLVHKIKGASLGLRRVAGGSTLVCTVIRLSLKEIAAFIIMLLM